MYGKKLMLLLVFIFALSIFTACIDGSNTIKDPSEQSDDNGENEDTITDALDGNYADDEDAEDYIWDSSDVVYITLDEDKMSVTGEGVAVSGSIATISSAGTYSASGILDDGQIIVDAEDEDIVKLILNGVDISCSTSAPIYVKNAKKTIIILLAGTSNSIIDGNNYTLEDPAENEPNAAIFSKDYLSIFSDTSGNGSLMVDGNYNDCIASKNGLIIKSGIINIYAKDDGIRGKDYLIIRSGNITINAGGDGLKSDNEDDSTKGYIYIEAGTIDITSGGDAIAAKTDVLIADGNIKLNAGGGSNYTVAGDESAKGIKGDVNVIIEGASFTIDSADDAVHSNDSITINEGVYNISTADDAFHADYSIEINGGEIDISKSFEGIESAYITINNGNVNIAASDDGFNATIGSATEENDGSCLYLNGGSVYVNASGGDGLDCNGSIAVSGGTIAVHGPQSDPEVGMDYNGTCNISGGFLIISGTGSNMTQGPSTTSIQYSLKLITTTSNAAGTLFHLQDESGSNIVTFKPVRTYYSIVFSSPGLQNGSTYYVYTGGSSTGTNTNGIYEGGEYTPGNLYTSFTVSDIITSIGTGTGGDPGGGGGPPPPGQ